MSYIMELKTSAEIFLLNNVKDNIEEIYPCTRQDWIHFLVEQRSTNPNKIRIWASVTDDKITNYIVVTDFYNPPLTDFMSITYIWGKGREQNIELCETSFKWGRELGRKRFVGITTIPDDVCTVVGYKTIGRVVERIL